MLANKVFKPVTRQLKDRDGEDVIAIMIAVTICDKSTVYEFIGDVVVAVRNQRMCSPIDTSVLLITLIGDLPAGEFVHYWKQHVANDPSMEFYMSQMERAEVVHGTPNGAVIETLSLIE